MVYNLIVTDDAENDLQEAVEWYRSIGLGLDEELIRALEVCLWTIRRHPFQFPEVYKNVRRALLRKFPYSIFYFTFENTAVVLAVFHSRRNPKEWQDRV